MSFNKGDFMRVIRSVVHILLLGLCSWGNLFAAESRDGELYIRNQHHALQFECIYTRNWQQHGPITVYKKSIRLGPIREVSEVKVRRYGAWFGVGAEYSSFPEQLRECKKHPDRDCYLTIRTSTNIWDVVAEPPEQAITVEPSELKQPIDFFPKARDYEQSISERGILSIFSLGKPSELEPRHVLSLGTPYTAKDVNDRQVDEAERIQKTQFSDEKMPGYVSAMLADAVKYALALLRVPAASPEYQKLLIEFQGTVHPERVAHGKQVACDIAMRDMQVPADANEYLDAIIDLMWYLYSIALEKGQTFKEGTFVLQDADHKIYNFLLNYVKMVNPTVSGTERDKELMLSTGNYYAYPRVSSHFKDIKEHHVGARHYGIDIRHQGRNLAESLLPARMSHILFGDLFNGYIFIKLESVGIAAPSVAQHTLEFINAQLRKIIPGITPAQYNELVTYYIGTDDDPNYRKEHMPHKVLEDCSAIVDKENISPEQKQRIELQFVHQGIHGVYNEIHNTTSLLSPEGKQKLQNYLTNLERTEGLDYQDIRYGREVIIPHDRLVRDCR
jgi:hypothetical protein